MFYCKIDWILQKNEEWKLRYWPNSVFWILILYGMIEMTGLKLTWSNFSCVELESGFNSGSISLLRIEYKFSLEI